MARSLRTLLVAGLAALALSAPTSAQVPRDVQKQIDAAIDRGIDVLLATQLLDGSWAEHQPGYLNGGTALATYALLKSGLPPDHLTIRRALAYLDRNQPKKTYEAGCTLMLYAALGDASRADKAQKVLDDLLKWQRGDWGYGAGGGHKDLSNTQYGALGLWAAEKLGLDVPRQAWTDLVEAVLAYRVMPDGPVSGAVGFGYRPNGQKATGSMTTAGVGVLELCSMYLGDRLTPEQERARIQGMDWLDAHFAPDRNPGAGAGWIEYYLYGVERVGAFTEVRVFKELDWYLAGADWLLKQQGPSGGWPKGNGTPVRTSFGLLFLNRASLPTSGSSRGTRTYGTDDPKVAVNLRASGDTPLAVWVSSFGDEVLAAHADPEANGVGLRVERVDYLTDGGVVLPGSREGGVEWMTIAREPKTGWQEAGYDDRGWKPGVGGFGPGGSPATVVRTPWERDELWLRRAVELDPAELHEPRLVLTYGVGSDADDGRPQDALVKLFDEEPDFVQHLTHRPNKSKVEVTDEAKDGDVGLLVTGRTTSRPRVPGWMFPIVEEPGPGEFRHLSFAWRTDSAAVLLELAIDGEWRRAVRVHAGPRSQGFERQASVEVDDSPPRRWEEVTIDLYDALKGRGLLTGIALTPMEGSAEFDSIYLARTTRDLRKARSLRDEPVVWGAATVAPPPGEAEVWVNGQRVVALDRETRGAEVVLEGDALKDALVPGENLFAVYARNEGEARALDLALYDLRLLARVPGDPTQAAGEERWPARVSFTRPGAYEVRARVHAVDRETGDPLALESPVLTVRIADTPTPELIGRVGRHPGDVLKANLGTALASSMTGTDGANTTTDGRVATGWRCAAGDPAPTLTFTLKRAQRADTLVLRPHPATGARPLRVRVVLDGEEEEAVVADLETNPVGAWEVPLGKARKIGTLEIRVVDRTEKAGQAHPSVGFAEVELVASEAN